MRYFKQYFRVETKKNGISLELQFNHIRRFVNFENFESVSPFIYSVNQKVNYTRVVSTKAKLESLVGDTVIPVSTPIPLFTYHEWLKQRGQPKRPDPPKFLIHYVTPLAFEYRDGRVYYQVFPMLAAALQHLREKALVMGLAKGLPSVFKGKVGNLVRNLQPCAGNLSVKPFYARNEKVVYGMIGHLEYDLSEIASVNPDAIMFFDYCAYLLHFLTVGYRDMTLALPYRGDVQPMNEIPELGNVIVSVHPIQSYPIYYSI